MNPTSLEKALARAWPAAAWTDVTVLVAVSGGADSVALLTALTGMKRGGDGKIIVAHLNHHLRGVHSDQDERFVRELAAKLGVECRCGELDPADLKADRDGVEAAARHRRYRFLTTTAEHVGARYVALAHTADDQIETILHRILRGTGIAGLAGIPRCRRLSDAVTLIRPLLEVRRTEIVEHLQKLGQPFREDASNTDTRFTRNRIRHELLPHLAKHYNPAIGEALLRLGQLAGQSQSVIDALVRDLIAGGAVEKLDTGLLVSRDKLSGQPDYLVRELLMHVWQSQNWPLQAMGFEEWRILVEMLRCDPEACEAVPSKQTFPGQVLAERCETGLHLRVR